jgi:hypothetical protein
MPRPLEKYIPVIDSLMNRGLMKKRTWLLIPIMILLVTCSTKPTLLPTPLPVLPTLQNPILFVTQFPVTDDFATVVGTFGSHEATLPKAGRGGDLFIRYGDGTLRNLTAEAGFGVASGFQGEKSIAVRDPAVHWSGTKAIFSMVIGAPTRQHHGDVYNWQLYEITGFLSGEKVVITLLPNQPPHPTNNIQPTYASNGDVIFVSDRTRDGAAHLYPQHDEYESVPTPTGLWRLSKDGKLTLLEHAPSGSFTPTVDSYGRIIFTRWDHLQRDQQGSEQKQHTYNTFNFSGEGVTSTTTTSRDEQFPEPWGNSAEVPGAHRFNHFFPWQLNQDGTGAETLNHISRHELFSYFATTSIANDPNIVEFINPNRTNKNAILNFFQIREYPNVPGRYIGLDAPEFETYSSGQLIRLDAPPTLNPSDMKIEYLTPRSTFGYNKNDADHTGHYRNPLPLSDGTLITSHTDYRGGANDSVRGERPSSPYQFRLKKIVKTDTDLFYTPGEMLTHGIVKDLNWFDPGTHVHYQGPFWELSPVEVVARPAPPDTQFALNDNDPEADAFRQEGVVTADFLKDLREKNLAVIVIRNATSRDAADRQQPFNLRVAGNNGTSTMGTPGKVYDISHMQFFQADQIRGWRGSEPTFPPKPGRRVLAQRLHDVDAVAMNSTLYTDKPAGPDGSVPIFSDGSAAIYVPTRRAMAWQSTAPDQTPVVRERYWITFQPGEIRACNGCHGVNKTNQAGQSASQNTALAFREMLKQWKASQP